MLRTRVIPCLLVRNGSLVKTRQFDQFVYVGDPANTCRIFNECEVDELAIVDINASIEGRGPDFALLAELAEECFMPVAYGGGITTIQQAERVLRLGMEKVIVGTAAYDRPELLTEISAEFGTQCVVAAIDVHDGSLKPSGCYGRSGTMATGRSPIDWAREVEDRGAGEILLTSIAREGTWSGFDQALTRSVSDAVSIPVIAHGGAQHIGGVASVVREGGASAVAVGNMVVFQKKDMGVLVNFPDPETLKRALGTVSP